MEFNINNNRFEVSWKDGQAIIRTSKGEFRHEYTIKQEVSDDDMPSIFFDAMAGTSEGEAFPVYRDWLKYICERDCKRNRKDHARFLEQARLWHEVSEVTADDILTYLSENFDI